jgi:hypothetical protein
VLAVPGGRSRADDRDRPVEPPEQSRVAAHPEHGRGVQTEIVESARPLGVARHQEPRSEPGGLPEVQRSVDLPDAGSPAVDGIRERCVGQPGAGLRLEPCEGLVRAEGRDPASASPGSAIADQRARA